MPKSTKIKTLTEEWLDDQKEEEQRQEAILALASKKGKLSPTMQACIDNAMVSYLQEQVREAINQVRKPLSATEVRKLRDDIALLREQACYFTKIRLSFGRRSGSIVFKAENLGISSELHEAVEDAGINMTIKVNSRLQLAKSRLEAKRDAIIDDCLVPFGILRVLPASKLLEWDVQIHHMEILLEKERLRVLAWYDTSLLDYCIRVGACIENAGYYGVKANELMESYVRQFPSRQEVYDSMNMFVMPRIKISSIKEAILEDSELAQSEAVRALSRATELEAETQMQLTREREMAEMRSLQQTQAMLRDHVRNVADNMAFHYLSLVKATLDQVKDANCKPTTEQRILFNEAMEQMNEFLLSENQNMQSMFQKMQGLQRIFGEEVTGERVQVKQQEVKACIDNIFNEHMQDFVAHAVALPGRRASALSQAFDDFDEDDEE